MNQMNNKRQHLISNVNQNLEPWSCFTRSGEGGLKGQRQSS